MFAKAIFHIRQKLTPIPIPIQIMCDIATTHPDAHAAAAINHIVSLAVSAIKSIISCSEKGKVDAFYLDELKTHQGLSQPLPSKSDMHRAIVSAIMAEVKDYEARKSDEQIESAKSGARVYQCSFPENLPEIIATLMNPFG